jgi:glucosamine-6-phosphate deaminase
MHRHLFGRVNIPAGHVNFLDGDAKDLDAECARFDRAIVNAGGIDLLVLGIGANGHVGFNEPANALFAHTHRARLTAATRRANAGLFAGRPAMVPREALSMGMGTILAARAILLIATGRSKARAINAMLSGRITPSLPASFLQLHADVQLVLDRSAAGRLKTAESAEFH